MTTDGPGVFLSYRRKEPGHAGRLHDRLVEDLGEDRVFMDVDSIRPGEDWIEAISRALARCGLMLVLVGDQWGQAGRDSAAVDSDDPVLFEIEAAFDHGIQIIPVLLDDAVIPRHADLPDTLVKLFHLQAMRVRHDTFRSDAARLVTVVHEVLDAYEKAGNRAPSVLNDILAPHETAKVAPDPADQIQPGGEIGASPSTGRRSEDPPPATGSGPRTGLARRLLIPLLTLVSLAAVGFALWTFTSTTARVDLAAAEEIAEPIGTAVNPFLVGVGHDVPQTRPPNARGPVTGDTEGLYGGTRRGTSCDTAKLIAFLQTHPDKGAAWAGVLKLTLQQIPSFVAELTPLILRADTRVTNHGFKDGKITSFPSILQAGTAVLVDKQGVPVVKCYCGNPLTPPRQVAHSYQGNAWPGFDAQKVIDIKPAPTAVQSFTVVDHTTGKKFSKETGVRVTSPSPEQPDPTEGSASPTQTEAAVTDDTASPTPTETVTTDDTASPTPTDTPRPDDTPTESESPSPTESDTADPPPGGDSQDAGDSREPGREADSGQEGGDSQGSSGSGNSEEDGSGDTQTGTDNSRGTDNQQDTSTNGGASTNPDSGGANDSSPDPG